MARPRSYNPNTKAGRRNLRDTAVSRNEALPADERTDYELWGCLIMAVIIVIVAIIAFASGNQKGFFKWLK